MNLHLSNEHPCFVWEKEIQKASLPLFKQLRINYFGQTRVMKSAELTALVTNTELAAYWYEQQYPIPGTSSEGFALPPGFYLASLFESYLPANLLKNIKEKFDLSGVLFIVKEARHYNDVYMLAAGAEQQSIVNNYLNNTEFIHQFLNHYEQLTKPMMLDATFETVQLPFQFERKLQYTSIIAHEKVYAHYQSDLIQKNLAQKSKQLSMLTNREYACLELIAHGMTAKLASRKLCISFRTVETHIKNIRNKLECSSIKEVVSLYWAEASGCVSTFY